MGEITEILARVTSISLVISMICTFYLWPENLMPSEVGSEKEINDLF
jgi:hypothetical protein